LREATGHLLYYVLMDNHYHLLLEMKVTPINVIMQRLNTSYGRHFAHAYHTSGAVFGNRYAVEEVSEADYFGNVIKYIAMNPVRAGIVQNIGEYRWSAHLDLVQKKEPFGLTVSDCSRFWAGHPKKARLISRNDSSRTITTRSSTPAEGLPNQKETAKAGVPVSDFSRKSGEHSQSRTNSVGAKNRSDRPVTP